jgi:hypothetical protein
MWAAAVLVVGYAYAIVPAHGFKVGVFSRGNNGVGRGCHLPRTTSRQSVQRTTTKLYGRLPVVWVEDAEDGFVDEDENLEDGEVCLRSLKAFASKPVEDEEDDSSCSQSRFLCAGALVQRPWSLSHVPVCDAWTADSILTEGGPNLQLQGALKVLDELLLFQLQRHGDDPILALQSFVVRCGTSLDSEYTCASYMAATARGFRPLRELVRINSIYSDSHYDNDLDGLVLCADEGKEIYRKLASEGKDLVSMDSRIASTIYHLLPDDDTRRRFTRKRYVSPER